VVLKGARVSHGQSSFSWVDEVAGMGGNSRGQAIL
jgi:hypothetical protein